MLLMIGALLIMLGTAYAQYRNGLFSSFAMLIMVLISGLVAFGFFEPIADALDPVFQNNSLSGCEDMVVLVLLFAVTLFLLRLATTYLNPEMIDEHGKLQHIGGAGGRPGHRLFSRGLLDLRSGNVAAGGEFSRFRAA